MLDLDARRSCAASLRRFAAGLSTVDEFEREVESLDDDATEAFFLYAWLHYDDFKTERLRGYWRLSGNAKRHWARWALYLATDEAPYPWRRLPERAWAAFVPFGSLLRFATGRPPAPEYEKTGVYAKHYPFRDRAHLRKSERGYLRRFANDSLQNT